MPQDVGNPGADRPRVVAIPPVVYAVAFGAGLLLEAAGRTTVPGAMLRFGLGGGLVVLGVGLMGLALRAFQAAGTHVEVYRPTTALVVTGPYRFTRNPIYVGMTMAYLGAGLLADSLWVLGLAVPALAVMHYGVVLHEEAYLMPKFGERYQEYVRRVRRWI